MKFCYKTASVWLLVGKLFFILKILVPLAIIILAMIEYAKVAISTDSKDSAHLQNSTHKLIKKLIIALVIYFIPTFVKLGFEFVAGFNDNIKNDASTCFKCVTDPYNSCDTSYKGEIFTK